jgi:hypothetical protein
MHGFPPRPKHPTLLSEWENLMQSLARSTFIEPEFRRTDRRHGLALKGGRRTRDDASESLLSANWSGGIVFPPAGGQFSIVAGRWTVPSPIPNDDNNTYDCGSWIGIDGWNSSDRVLQVGVDWKVRNETLTTIYPWFEWYPENEIQIPNAVVNVGDFVICTISAESSNRANIIFSNNTNHQYWAAGVTAPTGTVLVGDSAEWIVERTAHNGVTQPLANYGSVTFVEAWGGTSDAVRDPSQGEGIDMYRNIPQPSDIISFGEVGYRQVTCTYL